MTFREFLLWQEYDIKPVTYFEPGAQVPSAVIQKMPKTGFANSGARVMSMVKAVNPTKPIFRKQNRTQALSGIANK